MSWTLLIVILVVVMAVAASKALRRSLVLLAAMAAIAVLVLRLLAAHGPGLSRRARAIPRHCHRCSISVEIRPHIGAAVATGSAKVG